LRGLPVSLCLRRQRTPRGDLEALGSYDLEPLFGSLRVCLENRGHIRLKTICDRAILRLFMCPTAQHLALAMRSAEAEAHYRHFVRTGYLENTNCAKADLAFVDQAIAEAEMRLTEARFALDEHTTVCRSCSMANSN
jgi:hypothetical protein